MKIIVSFFAFVLLFPRHDRIANSLVYPKAIWTQCTYRVSIAHAFGIERDSIGTAPSSRRHDSIFPTRFSPSRSLCFSKRNPNVNEELEDKENAADWLVLFERISSILCYPTPGINPSLALIYPLVLFTSPLVVPPTLAILLILFFGIYSYIGRRFILSEWKEYEDERVDSDDEDERPATDLFALGAAVITSGLLNPYHAASDSRISLSFSSSAIFWVGAMLFVFFAQTLANPVSGESQESVSDESPEQKLMDIWDRELFGEEDDRKLS